MTDCKRDVGSSPGRKHDIFRSDANLKKYKEAHFVNVPKSHELYQNKMINEINET